jgi:hypothetical protein
MYFLELLQNWKADICSSGEEYNSCTLTWEKTRKQDWRTAKDFSVSDKVIKCRHFSEAYLTSSEHSESRNKAAYLPQ